MTKKRIHLGLVFLLCPALGCSGASGDPDTRQSDQRVVVSQDVPLVDRPQLCEMVTMAEVSAITRGEYVGSEQQVDYATLTHCAYIGGSGGGVSMLYGSGDQVPRRWDSTNKSQATLVEGFWEEAVWESGIGTGTLTAKRGDVLVEIGISKSLAKDEQEQIEMSKQLATLVAAKF